jgi:heptosyltransferase-2
VDTYRNILIIQTAFIGDVILTTPLIEVLKKEYPDTEIDFLTIPASKVLLDTNPKIREVIVFDKRGKDKGLRGLMQCANRLKQKNYDLCLTPHRSLRSALLSGNTRAKVRIGFNRSALKLAFTHIVKYESRYHEIERNLSLLSAIGLYKKIVYPAIYENAEDKKKVQSFFKTKNIENDIIFAVAPGSVWPTKRWPEAYYLEFCQILSSKGIQVILIGGAEDRELCNRISEKLSLVHNSAGYFSLRESYYLLKKCSGILTNDSAPLHLGMAAEIPVFAIFGPTVPEFGFAPFGAKSKIFEINNLKCRPCAIHGSKKCPIKTFDCMNNLQPANIANRVLDEL